MHLEDSLDIGDNGEGVIDTNFVIYSNKKIGKWHNGDIYLGKYIPDNKLIAIKVERFHESLPKEQYKLLLIGKEKGIINTYNIYLGTHHTFLFIELLGKNLEELFQDMKGKFSIKTISQIALQMIERIKFIHSKKFIYRDIKPENFVIGRDSEKNLIYLIDFGLAKKYIKYEEAHIDYEEGKSQVGTPIYASLNSHHGIQMSRRDDLEEIAYSLIYFMKGRLPWQDFKVNSEEDEEEEEACKKIMEMKEKISPEELCQNLPVEFLTLLKYSRNLKFKEKPDYDYLQNMFKNLIISNNQEIDMKFDWD